MYDMLAVAVGDAVETGAGVAVGSVGLYLVQRILSFKKLHAEIDLGGGSNGKHAPAPTVCPAHEGLVKLLDERNTIIHTEFGEIKESLHEIHTSLGTIHRRIDKVLDP